MRGAALTQVVAPRMLYRLTEYIFSDSWAWGVCIGRVEDIMTDSDAVRGRWHPFESALSVMVEDIVFEFRGHEAMPWSDYLLNPRRLRGSDFLM